ncbi:unnamed protein product [Linum trigynum]|uniref:Uncharacterized protein n=1 Tax=Linum trigynum TaxID=586398 RepID=A0AAV2D0A4_9ROSI
MWLIRRSFQVFPETKKGEDERRKERKSPKMKIRAGHSSRGRLDLCDQIHSFSSTYWASSPPEASRRLLLPLLRLTTIPGQRSSIETFLWRWMTLLGFLKYTTSSSSSFPPDCRRYPHEGHQLRCLWARQLTTLLVFMKQTATIVFFSLSTRREEESLNQAAAVVCE